MIHLRTVRSQDVPLVDNIWRKHHSNDFGVPSMANVIDSKVLSSDGRVVGLGMVKLFAEGVIILDKDVPLTTRAKGILIGIDHALDVVRRAGLEQFHVMTTDPHYVKVLQRHWDFRTVPETVLYREI